MLSSWFICLISTLLPGLFILCRDSGKPSGTPFFGGSPARGRSSVGRYPRDRAGGDRGDRLWGEIRVRRFQRANKVLGIPKSLPVLRAISNPEYQLRFQPIGYILTFFRATFSPGYSKKGLKMPRSDSMCCNSSKNATFKKPVL